MSIKYLFLSGTFDSEFRRESCVKADSIWEEYRRHCIQEVKKLKHVNIERIVLFF